MSSCCASSPLTSAPRLRKADADGLARWRLRISRVRVRGDAPRARPRGCREAGAQAEAPLCPCWSDRGQQARAQLLGEGVVRQPRVVRRLREPTSARPELRTARSRHRPADRGREHLRVDQRDVDLRGRRDDSIACLRRAGRRSLPSAPGRSTHSSICCAASCRRRSWRSSRARTVACFPRPSRSPSSAHARTGPGCASTSPPRSTVSAFAWTRSPSCSSTFAA